MKTENTILYCSHCGDEILPSEQSSPKDSLCALCEHMALEAKEIYGRKKKQQLLPVNLRAKYRH
ncbi:MAG: hypothetical protein ACU83N_12170 [Gammaproteobacteria bacterium]